MSSAMMTRMLGFCGCCAEAGTIAQASDASAPKQIVLIALTLARLRCEFVGHTFDEYNFVEANPASRLWRPYRRSSTWICELFAGLALCSFGRRSNSRG